MKYSDIISKRIKDLCQERHITINKLATLSGITQSTIEDIVSGRTKNPKLITLHHITQGLNITMSEFFDFPEMNESLFDDEN